MKMFMLAAACATMSATAFVVPAIAEDAPAAASSDAATSERPMHHMRGEGMGGEGKAMREGFKDERKAMGDEHRKEAEAAREACRARMEAATSADAKKAIVTDCRAKADAMRKQFFDEESKRIAERRAEEDKHMAEMGAKREEMKAKREELHAKRDASTSEATAR